MKRSGRARAKWAAIGSLSVVLLLGGTGTAVAVPPPPPNPSDSELDSSRDEADAKAGEVGKLTNRLAEAESRLGELQADVELKMEDANKARVDMETAQDEASAAQRDAESAGAEADAAASAVENARADLDKFVGASYQQGSTIGSVSAYLGSDSPKDLLARAQLLDAVGGSQVDALEGMQRAQTDKSNKDSEARKKLEVAREKQAAAERAKSNADAAQNEAVRAQQDQEAENGRLESEKSDVERRLYEAQSKVSGLEGQRQRYEDWQAQKRAEEEEQARKAAMAQPAPSGGKKNGGSAGRPSAPSAPAGRSVESVIARAMSQLGVVYAWGGGNQSGPTRGIRDGGVADAHGDYRKVGFDCSGLMIYAFAGVKGLAHYSGYQYNSGTKVPLSQMRRGDMLFWGRGGRIHHVALYLGNGQMIEAPHSGSVVKVSPVRYGGIMPYATRLIG
ncbi:NlpC/P60 family protein [Amycolatopsis sp. YIM 10]|uniref:NlpC/P60 family protein n=1 Tax=Amycolatopsis sp. YIM 10 TaxID=2653857 RepID=UPI00128FF5C4|nr:NlpC/P60 family protein [Amycolatopsis sp. YIM 10]QFU90697.1 Peptidoglycan endopeptidase RipA precursor [Amycolatopsis sp. YIM 10]